MLRLQEQLPSPQSVSTLLSRAVAITEDCQCQLCSSSVFPSCCFSFLSVPVFVFFILIIFLTSPLSFFFLFIYGVMSPLGHFQSPSLACLWIICSVSWHHHAEESFVKDSSEFKSWWLVCLPWWPFVSSSIDGPDQYVKGLATGQWHSLNWAIVSFLLWIFSVETRSP